MTPPDLDPKALDAAAQAVYEQSSIGTVPAWDALPADARYRQQRWAALAVSAYFAALPRDEMVERVWEARAEIARLENDAFNCTEAVLVDHVLVLCRRAMATLDAALGESRDD